MRGYIMDMRQYLNKLKEEQENSLVILDENKQKEFRYESEHYPNVYLEDVKVGDCLYIYTSMNGYANSKYYWLEIEITHMYGGVYFYKIVKAPTNDLEWYKERHFEEGSIAALRNIYPKKVVITEDYKFTSVCPLIEFIYDNDTNNKYSSIFNLDEKKKY